MKRKRNNPLMERAMEHLRQRPGRKSKPVTADEIDVALAWLRSELHLGQVKAALGHTDGAGAIYRVAVILKEAHERGRLIAA